MFRRRTTDAPGGSDQDQAGPPDAAANGDSGQLRPGITAKKAAPTPKRSEAQANRRQPYVAPADRKAATAQTRERDRVERLRKSQALSRGEDWALPAKDRGPVRRLARDVVDARRGIGEYYLVTIVLLVVLLALRSTVSEVITDGLVIAILLVIAVEGWWVTNKVKRLASERFPGESTKGLGMYVTMRGISMRRMRMPKPRVNRGDPV